ncbi:pyridoxamine 5'-phosphate oxidase family protein [Rhodococcus opacus]|uniref:pyridoxamine 5'-phosphate oxidase family protein n=1 Tax=Rhodococcus opacus TaxID=37919 RepID=UPI0024BAF797|nr:pyridoxamine 5'-phosphate oxidase family protein [Rhodococcus opacus]MDJ0419836.1 pyridoxamine 5'-phosphate oxidase family protein [Rhodococcus opacus]
MDLRLESADGPLTTGESLGLLRSVPTGRLVYTEDALPAVRPVTFAAPDGEIVIPTGDNPWFDRFDDTVLALEAGSIASSTRTGWTVLAIGRSRLLHGTDNLDGFDDPARAPWSDVPGARYLVIDIGHLRGHRTTLPRPAGDHR